MKDLQFAALSYDCVANAADLINFTLDYISFLQKPENAQKYRRTFKAKHLSKLALAVLVRTNANRQHIQTRSLFSVFHASTHHCFFFAHTPTSVIGRQVARVTRYGNTFCNLFDIYHTAQILPRTQTSPEIVDL